MSCQEISRTWLYSGPQGRLFCVAWMRCWRLEFVGEMLAVIGSLLNPLSAEACTRVSLWTTFELLSFGSLKYVAGIAEGMCRVCSVYKNECGSVIGCLGESRVF